MRVITTVFVLLLTCLPESARAADETIAERIYTLTKLSNMRKDLDKVKDSKVRDILFSDDEKVDALLLKIKYRGEKVLEISISVTRTSSPKVEFIKSLSSGDDFDLLVAKLKL